MKASERNVTRLAIAAYGCVYFDTLLLMGVTYMSFNRPSRKHDSTWRTFAIVGVRPSRAQLTPSLRDSNGHVAKRYEIKGLRVDWHTKPAPRGVKRDHAESLVAPVRQGERLVAREVAYAPTLCLTCGEPAELNTVFCSGCAPKRGHTRE